MPTPTTPTASPAAAPVQAETPGIPATVKLDALTFVPEVNRASKKAQANVEAKLRAITPGYAAVFPIVKRVKDGKTTTTERGQKQAITKAITRLKLSGLVVRAATLNGERVVAVQHKE